MTIQLQDAYFYIATGVDGVDGMQSAIPPLLTFFKNFFLVLEPRVLAKMCESCPSLS